MCADAELQAGPTDRGHVSLRQIFLAEMNEIAAFVDRHAPMVVDDKLATVSLAYGSWRCGYRYGLRYRVFP